MPILRWLSLITLMTSAVCLADDVVTSKELGATEDLPIKLQPSRERTELDHQRLQAATMVMEGRLLERRGQSKRALQRYQRAYRLDADASIVLKQIVPLALELGRIGVATRYATLLADTELDDPFLAERLAMLLSDQLEYDKALQLFQRVLTLQAREPEPRNMLSVHFEMGRLYFLTEKYAHAARSFRIVWRAIESREQSNPVRDAILAEPALTYNLMAECFLEAGEFDDAAALFELAAASHPTEDWLPVQLARVDFRAGRDEQARPKLDNYRRRKLQFAGSEPYRILCELLRREEPDSEGHVLDTFRAWLGEDPENFSLLTFVANLCHRGGVLEEAAQHYESSIKQQPSLDAYRGLVTIYRQVGDSEKLLDVLGRVTTEIQGLEPFADELQEIIKDRELLSRLFELGRKRIQAGVTVGRGIAAACGLVAIDAQEFKVADEFIPQLRHDPEATQLLLTCGLELLLAEEHERAAGLFQQAVDSNAVGDDASVFLYYLAGALQLIGQTEPALEAARRTIVLNGEVPEFSLRPAWILYHAGRIDEATNAYSQWLKEFDDNYEVVGVRDSVRDARFVLSNIHVAQERPHEAAECLELVLDEFPNDTGALNDLGYLLVDQGLCMQRALTMIQKAVAAEPDNKAYRDSLGWALHRLGRHAEAVHELKLAIDTTHPDPVILDHLAEAEIALGNTENAIRVWQQAMGLLQDDRRKQKLRMRVHSKLSQHLVESK